MKHHLWMLAACVLPLVLLFAFSAIGIRSDAFFAFLLLACFAMHLWMIKAHTQGGKGKGGPRDEQD